MRKHYLLSLSIIVAMLSPCAHGAVGVTNIVQLHAPMLFHSDGAAYTPSDLAISDQRHRASIAYTNGVADLRAPTGQLAQCSGRDCTEQPLGFLSGTAPAGGTLRSSELDRRNMDTLMHVDAYQHSRTDLYLEDDGDSGFSQAGGGVDLRFQVAESDSMTFSFGVQQYLHAFYDAETKAGSFVQTETRLSLELWDATTSSTMLYYTPAVINYTIRLDGSGPLEVIHDEGMQYFSVESDQLQPGHVYALAFRQLTYSRAMIGDTVPLPVPEPSTMLMYLGGLVCLFMPVARRRIPHARRLLASLMLVLPGAVGAAEGSSAFAGLDLYGLRLLHADGTRYEWSDFATRAPITHFGTVWTDANGKEHVSGTNSSPGTARQGLHACTGTACPMTAFPTALTGDTAYAGLQSWQMSDFVAADAYQHIQVNAAAASRRSRAEIDMHTEMWNFNVTSPGSMAVEFDARAHALVEGSASATIGFRAWLTDNRTGTTVALMPDALNLQLHAGGAAYDSGLQTFTFNIPLLYPGPGYFLVFEQSLIVTAVPEPAPAALYGVGMLGLLAWAARRRDVTLSG